MTFHSSPHIFHVFCQSVSQNTLKHLFVHLIIVSYCSCHIVCPCFCSGDLLSSCEVQERAVTWVGMRVWRQGCGMRDWEERMLRETLEWFQFPSTYGAHLYSQTASIGGSMAWTTDERTLVCKLVFKPWQREDRWRQDKPAWKYQHSLLLHWCILKQTMAWWHS